MQMIDKIVQENNFTLNNTLNQNGIFKQFLNNIEICD